MRHLSVLLLAVRSACDLAEFDWKQPPVTVKPDLSIVTPCKRPDLLKTVAESIRFELITRWIIVYDVNVEHKHLDSIEPKVMELDRPPKKAAVAAGHSRNFALTYIPSGLVYFLDDDNAIHPDLWRLIPLFRSDHIYTFDRYTPPGRAHPGRHKGNICAEKYIDSSQFVVDRDLIGNFSFDDSNVGEDGRWINRLCSKYQDRHVYLPFVLSYYNALRTGGTGSCKGGCDKAVGYGGMNYRVTAEDASPSRTMG